jgi:hypothetical protein
LVVHDPVVRAGAVLAGLGRLSFRWKISLLVSLLLNFSSPSMVRQKNKGEECLTLQVFFPNSLKIARMS